MMSNSGSSLGAITYAMSALTSTWKKMQASGYNRHTPVFHVPCHILLHSQYHQSVQKQEFYFAVSQSRVHIIKGNPTLPPIHIKLHKNPKTSYKVWSQNTKTTQIHQNCAFTASFFPSHNICDTSKSWRKVDYIRRMWVWSIINIKLTVSKCSFFSAALHASMKGPG